MPPRVRVPFPRELIAARTGPRLRPVSAPLIQSRTVAEPPIVANLLGCISALETSLARLNGDMGR